MRPAILIALASVLSPSAGYAHDFWLVPSAFRADAPVAIWIALRVGGAFPEGEPYPRDPSHVRRFVVAGPNGEHPVPGRPGADPAGQVALDRPGTWVAGYWSRPTVVEMPAERFQSYGRSEALAETILRLRPVPSDAEGSEREAFSRCAKSIVVVGSGRTGHDRVLGFPLELVPERSPADVVPGNELTVRLLYDGTPLPDTPVVAMPGDAPGRRTWARTDSAGRARLAIDRSGVWLVRGIRLATAADRAVADWESLWASLTFEVPAAPSGSPPAPRVANALERGGSP